MIFSSRRTGPLLLATALAGCTTPQMPVQTVSIPPASLGLGERAVPALPSDWWRSLGDPQLDRIITEALAGNPTLDAAMARVRAAQSAIAGASAASQPQIAIDASEQGQRFSGAYVIPPPYGGSTKAISQAQSGLTWELDFWHRQADRLHQAGALADSAALDYAATRLGLTGAIVTTYIELARTERQIALARATVDQRLRARQLVDVRHDSGLASQIDTRAADTLLAEARQVVTEMQSRRDNAVHALAALAGRGAEYYRGLAPTSLTFETLLPLPDQLPADLLARRPDIASAQSRIAAASAGRELARKAYYPNVNLLGLAGLQALGVGDMFTGSAVTVSGGAAIHLPIFTGGRLRADYAGATARLDQAIADYNHMVVQAVRETADAISDINALHEEMAQQQTKLAGLDDLSQLAEVRLRSGLGTRLDLIDNEMRRLAARQQAVNQSAALATARIRLVQALGGDFQAADAADAIPARTRNNP